MFYAQFVLSKKGPLAKIWLAAHWEKKLSKAQIYETNVQDAVDEILKPKVKMALRTTGHLLLGIVRIYSRKTKYLLADCNEAFLKLKMAFRPGQVEVVEDGQEAPINAITLPEVYADFDTALPDFSDMDIQHHLQLNQSRIDDITLKEDLVSESNSAFGHDFGMDDFGESSLPGGVLSFNVEEQFALGAPGEESFLPGEIPREKNGSNISNVEMLRDGTPLLDAPVRDIRDPTPSLDEAKAPERSVFGDDEFDAGGDDGYEDGAHMDEMPDYQKMDVDAPGAELDDLQLGAAATDLTAPAGDVPIEQSFALDPLDSAALADKAPRQRRKRRLIIDEPKNISGEEMKSNMADFSDTLQPLDLAPPTRKLMKLRDCGNVEKLFHLPGNDMIKSKPIVRFYQTMLVLQVRADEQVDHEDVRKELELAEQIEEPDAQSYMAPSESNIDDFDIGEVGGFDDPASPIPMVDPTSEGLGLEAEPLAPEADVLLSPTDKSKKDKKNKSQNETTFDDDVAAEGDEDHRFTKRTQNVLNSIQTKLRTNQEHQILLSDLLTKASNRKTAAQKFYTLLVLKKWQAIDVQQTAPFDEILITAGPNIDQTMAH